MNITRAWSSTYARICFTFKYSIYTINLDYIKNYYHHVVNIYKPVVAFFLFLYIKFSMCNTKTFCTLKSFTSLTCIYRRTTKGRRHLTFKLLKSAPSPFLTPSPPSPFLSFSAARGVKRTQRRTLISKSRIMISLRILRSPAQLHAQRVRHAEAKA